MRGDTVDLIGLLVVLAYLMGMGAVTVRAWMLAWKGQRSLAGLLIVAALLYLGSVLTDAPSVLTVLTNGVDDIPPTSSLRTGLFAVWVWGVHSLLLMLYRRRP